MSRPEHPAATGLDAAVVLVHGLVAVAVAGLRLLDGEGLDHGFVPLQLVVLEGEDMVGPPVGDGLCNSLLTDPPRGTRSMVTMQPSSTSIASRSGMAVLAWEWSSTRRAVSAPGVVVGTAGRRQRLHPACETAFQLWGASRAQTRPKVSCEGMPCGSARNVASQTCFWCPNSSTSVPRPVPQMTARVASRSMSPRGYAAGPGADGTGCFIPSYPGPAPRNLECDCSGRTGDLSIGTQRTRIKCGISEVYSDFKGGCHSVCGTCKL